MAKRRCINVDLFESDAYVSLSSNAKMLYVFLILKSDDEGVVINTPYVMRGCKARLKDLQELLEKRLVLEVCGEYVIRHWHMHNRISPSKVTKSVHRKVMEKLRIEDGCVYELLQEDC